MVASSASEVVDAFFEVSRKGDFDALVEVLDPQVVLRSDGGEARPSANHVIRGAAEVAGRALTFANSTPSRTRLAARTSGWASNRADSQSPASKPGGGDGVHRS